jgi:hypothetical protein
MYDVFFRYINTYFHCIDDNIYIADLATVQSYMPTILQFIIYTAQQPQPHKIIVTYSILVI